MPQWIHDRAKRIQAENPSMPESESFAIATQQAHKLGKTPKGYGTAEGKREAKMKYDEPKSEYQKTAMFVGFFDELQKISAKVSPGALREAAEQVAKRTLRHKKDKEKHSQGPDMGGGGASAAAAAAPPPPPPPASVSPAGAVGGGAGGGGVAGPGGM